MKKRLKNAMMGPMHKVIKLTHEAPNNSRNKFYAIAVMLCQVISILFLSALLGWKDCIVMVKISRMGLFLEIFSFEWKHIICYIPFNNQDIVLNQIFSLLV